MKYKFVLNKKGMYNRCKLTRLVVDSEWEERMWKESWAKRVVTIDEECVGESNSSKRKETVRGSKKRIKLDQIEEVPWGEVGSAEEEERTLNQSHQYQFQTDRKPSNYSVARSGCAEAY